MSNRRSNSKMTLVAVGALTALVVVFAPGTASAADTR